MYGQKIEDLFKKIQTENKKQIKECSLKIKTSLDQGGVLYVFGSGHSSILAQEAFHRAGGLIPVYPIAQDFLSPLVSPKISGKLERLEGIASILFQRSGVSSKDIIWISSQSGINSAAIEMALEAKKTGVFSIATTSLTHSKAVQSRHGSGKRLFEIVDLVLDTHSPEGDALESFGQANEIKVGASSTLASVFIYNLVICEMCSLWSAEGKVLPIYQSANTPGGDVHNEKLEKTYRSRIPLL